MTPETKFELELTTEPETVGEFPHALPDTSDWDSLADVPFAGDISTILDDSSETDIESPDISGILD